MPGKTSAAHDKARAAYIKSGCSLTPQELARKFKVGLSTAYRIKTAVALEQAAKSEAPL